MEQALEAARTACGECRWGDAYRLLSPLPAGELDIDDLDRLASAAFMTGHDEEAFARWTQAHQRCVEAGSVHRALHFGTLIARGLGFKGDIARSRGWVERTNRLLDESRIDCVEQGLLHISLAMLRIFESGDIAGAHDHFVQACKIGMRFAHRELVTAARMGEGRMLIYMGELPTGMAMLDEVMVAIEAGELSPITTGDAYCTVIDACAELLDVERCRAWTDSFSRWCDTQQDLVMYRGHCFLHRAEVLGQLGPWSVALTEVRRACDRLAQPVNPSALAGACRVEGDLCRLIGDLDAAEHAYRRAIEHGLDPQPGLAMLRAEQGRHDSADAMIRRALGEATDPISRARLLGAYVDIVLQAGDRDGARAAAEELRAIATEIGTPALRAQACAAVGTSLLADGHADKALPEVRRAFTEHNALGLRYDAAMARFLVAHACETLGDHDAAQIERTAARATLDALRAGLERGAHDSTSPDGLTARELEVLRLLSQGKTNRAIAQDLVLSEKTVASHVSHIFTKLGVTSRSAATAYAYDHRLL